MANYPAHTDVVFVGTLKTRDIKLGHRLTHVVDTHQLTFRDLLLSAAAQRWRLGSTFFDEGKMLQGLNPPAWRLSISRLYYSMYHCVRACAFLAYEGDDHEGHSKLHTKTIDGFAPNIEWQTMLKDARLARNMADYDPFPIDNIDFETQAKTLLAQTVVLHDAAKQYLRAKGCQL